MTLPASDLDERRRLEAVVRRFPGRSVVVLGDLVVDEFVHGDISRISREAPVLILDQRKTVVVPGGGGNAAANLRALGATPVPVGLVGEDEAGRALLREFRARSVPTGGIVRHRDWSTPTKSRILAGGVHTRRQQIVRIDRGTAPGPLSPAVERRLDAALRRALERADGLLVADYGYGAATADRVEPVAAELRSRRVPVTVDSRSRLLSFRGVTACTPNQEEVERALELPPLSGDDDVEHAGRRLLRRTGDTAVLITRGSRGMSLFERRRPPLHVAAYGSDEVADVTGAGDTVIAVFTLSLLSGADFADAARLANFAAGLVVMKAGTATVEPEELLRALHDSGETP